MADKTGAGNDLAGETSVLNDYIRILMDNAYTYSLLADREAKVVYYSKSVPSLFGIPDASAIIGMPLDEACAFFMDKEYGKKARARVSRYLSGKTDFSEDEVIEKPNGDKRVYRISYKGITDGCDGYGGVLVSVQDLTDFRLEEAERRVQYSMQSTFLPCFIWDEKGELIACNGESVSVFGAPEGLSYPEYNEFFRKTQPEFQDDGRPTEEIRKGLIDEALEKGSAQTSIRLARADGAPLYFMVNLARIAWLFSYRLVVYFYDQADLIEKMSEADEAHKRIKLMLDSNPLICILRDDDGNVIDCNQEALNMLGIPNKAQFCDVFYSFFPAFRFEGANCPDRRNEIMRVLDEEGSYTLERTFWTSAGEPIPVESKIVKIPWMDTHYYLSFSRDLREVKANEERMREVTEREHNATLEREKAQAANEAKSQFLAKISHEIRTPMNSIIGFSELAMDDEITSRTRYYLEQIEQSSTWLLGIINDLLDISKIEADRMELERIPFDLQDVLSYCQSTMAPDALEKKIELVIGEEPLKGKRLLGDPTRLSQVLLNLLTNAVKFTDTGSVELTSAISGMTDTSVSIDFKVKDSGIGIPPDQIVRIYEPFMQADSSITRKYGGTGLGIPITNSILALMGSSLCVESEPGAGSEFSFSVTFDTVENVPGEDERLNQDGAPLKKPLFRGTVLVCEDSRMNQLVISEHLTRLGLQIEIAENGREGVRKVQRRIDSGRAPYDLILMDVHMPLMDGLQAAPIIDQMGTGTPIVAMTADIQASREFYKVSGMVDGVGKPFTSRELWRCLMKYLAPVDFIEERNEKPDDGAHRLQEQLKADFVANNRAAFNTISNAVYEGDIKLAHRLAHTLKSNAGLIGKLALQKAAADVEASLKGGENNLQDGQISTLRIELSAALDELAPYAEERPAAGRPAQAAAGYNEKAALELIGRLEPLLRSGNTEALGLVGELRVIPGSEGLIEQIEDFDFASAAASLQGLRDSLRP